MNDECYNEIPTRAVVCNFRQSKFPSDCSAIRNSGKTDTP